MTANIQAARMAPALSPFPPEVQASLDRTMGPGKPPLVLFTTLARDPRLFGKFFSGGLLERGHLTLRQREIVIHRTTARCGSEYEWGVHVSIFAKKVGFDDAHLQSLVHGCADDECWAVNERDLLRFCDAMHSDCTLDDALWNSLRKQFSEEAMLELLLLAGFYRTVSYLTNSLQLPLEPDAARFPNHVATR